MGLLAGQVILVLCWMLLWLGLGNHRNLALNVLLHVVLSRGLFKKGAKKMRVTMSEEEFCLLLVPKGLDIH